MDIQELISKKSDLEHAIKKSIQELVADFKLDTGMDLNVLNIAGVNIPVRMTYIYEKTEESEKLQAIAATNTLFEILDVPVTIKLGI